MRRHAPAAGQCNGARVIPAIGAHEDLVPHRGLEKAARISKQFEGEYYQGDTETTLLPDTLVPEGLPAIEVREACRVLKGQILRQEGAGLDDLRIEEVGVNLPFWP